MASFVYNEAKRAIAEKEIDFGTGGDDFRLRLVMTDTTCDTEDDVNFLSEFSVIDVMDGANYAEKALANEVVNEDVGNNRAEFVADSVTYTALGAGTRSVAGVLLYKFVTNDSDSVPIAYIDDGGFPFAANGGDVTINFSGEGIIQFT